MTLPAAESLTIREAGATREAWLLALGSSGDACVELNQGALTVVDTAGAQLVLSLQRLCEAEGRELKITPGHGLLTEQLERLGLESVG